MPIVNRNLSPVDTIGGLVLNLDASDARTITESTGVSQWDDKSTSQSNVANASGSSQPAYSLGAMGNKNVIDFDGSADFLSSSAFDGLNGKNDYTIFFVGNWADFKLQAGLGFPTAGNQFGLSFNILVDNNLTFNHRFPYGASGGDKANTSTPPAAGVPHVNTYLRDSSGGNMSLFVDGAIFSSEVPIQGAFNTPLSVVIGKLLIIDSQRLYDGEISEVIVYNQALSENNIGIICSYLGNKWGLEI